MRRLDMRVTLALLLALPIASLQAQNLGPFRQFLAIEPYYARTELDADPVADRVGVNGYGGRLWVNLAPFAGPHRTLISKGALAFFATYLPEDAGRNPKVWHYGVQHDAFILHKPFGNVIDPFLSVGAGAFRVSSGGTARTDFALSPGGGIRVPIPNRLQLRFDARDAMIFGSRTGIAGAKRTAHNIELLAALGITF